MPKALEEVTRDVLELPLRHRLALAELIIESAEGAADANADAAWESEIRDRIRAVDEGRASGIAYADAMRAAEGRLSP